MEKEKIEQDQREEQMKLFDDARQRMKATTDTEKHRIKVDAQYQAQLYLSSAAAEDRCTFKQAFRVYQILASTPLVLRGMIGN
jgi:hypothetical protein